jgi:DNA-binding MarR family transcriptional regulator
MAKPKEKPLCAYEGNIKLLLFLLVKSLKQDLEQRLKKARINTGMLGLAILHLLKKQDQTLGTLSQKLILAPATLVPAVNNLEAKGLIKRRPDHQDRRSHRLSLTPQGLKLLAGLPASLQDDPLIRQLQLLSPADRQKLHQLLNNLSQAIIGTSKLKSILNLCL